MTWGDDQWQRRRARLDAFNAARAEDLEWMAAGGETVEGAARRLGVTESALGHWCRRNERPDLWTRLLGNAVSVGSVKSGRVTLGRVS